MERRDREQAEREEYPVSQRAFETIQIEDALEQILHNRRVDYDALTMRCITLAGKLRMLEEMHGELQRYATALSQGDVEVEPPARSNYLAGGLKQLQAQMRHLTWQTQCVATGDYNQKVDFMGAFSQSFNDMVDQLREREIRIIEQQNIMMRVFDRMEPVLVVDEENHHQILYANRLAVLLLRLDQEKPEENADTIAQRIYRLDCREEEQQVEDTESGRWYGIFTSKLLWSNQRPAILYHCTDITIHKERENDLEQAASTDVLTGVSNRRVFDREVTQHWEICGFYKRPLSILVFDIDFFKRYNDTYGHMQGDQYLIAFAQVLKKHFGRSSDIIVRYGGEEFVVILPFTNKKMAVSLAEGVRKDVSTMEVTPIDGVLPGNLAPLTVSCGVACVVPDGQAGSDQLLLTADLALYEAKQRGRNQVYYRQLDASDQEELCFVE